MNSQQPSSMSITHVLLAGLVLQCLIPASSAQLTISTSSSSTPCYGDVVTLVCHHPELANSPGRYLTSTPTWRENGMRITPTIGTVFTAETAQDLMSTALTINITVDHFRNKSFYYSCSLVLAGPNGLPSGEVETSGNVTLDPKDLTPPPLTSINSLASTITLEWSDQPCTVRYSVSWMYTNDDGTTTTDSGVTELTNYTIPTSVGGVYTVSVEAVDGVGIFGPSTTASVESTYPRPVATSTHQPSCEERTMTLTCQVSGTNASETYRAITWMDASGPLASSSLYTIAGDQLLINDVTAIGDVKMLTCSVELESVMRVTGVVYNSSLANFTCITSLGPLTPTPSTALAALVVILVLLLAVLAVVGVACLLRKRSKIEDCKDEIPLLLFQVTDAMNRNGVKILSVQGQCVSSDCDPCSCEGEPSAVNVFGTFKEKTLVLSFIKGEGEERKKFLHDFDLQRTRLSADYCFALWVGGSVPGKVRSEVQREVRVGGGDCVVLPVDGFPWKVGSPEENQFVRSLYLSQVEIETTGQVAVEVKEDNEEVTVEVDEKHEVSITAPEPCPDAPPVDIHRMVKHILLSLQLGEGTDSGHKPPVPSMYASPYAPLESLEVGRSHSEPSSIQDSLVDGVASVLEILHANILSVGGQCRRAECQDGGTCTHVNTFQPDIAGVFEETSFVIKCVLYRNDRTVVANQLKTLNDVRKGMGLSLGLLVYDQTDSTPQVLSQQIPPNCLLVPVGAFEWDCQWVSSALLALYRGLCTPLTAETSPPTQEGVLYTEVKIDNPPRKPPALGNVVYSKVADIGEEAAEEAENRPPPLPQKREVTPPDPRDIQFQSDVIEVLEEIGVTVDVKKQTWFKGTYESLEFLAACRGEPDHDLKTTDVDTVLGRRAKMAVTKAVFICNSDTIPSDSLLKLDEAKCGFVRGFGHGSEKWKGRLIWSFEDTVQEWIRENNPSCEESKVLQLQEGKYVSLQEGTDVVHRFKVHGEMVQEPEAEESKHPQQPTSEEERAHLNRFANPSGQSVVSRNNDPQGCAPQGHKTLKDTSDRQKDPTSEEVVVSPPKYHGETGTTAQVVQPRVSTGHYGSEVIH